MRLLAIAYESARERLGMDYPAFAEAVRDFECIPVEVGGELCGAVLIHGPEIHACIQPKGFRRWITKGRIREILGTVIEKYGYATTSVSKGNEIGDRFVRRMGFEYIGEEGSSMRYRMDAMRWRI